MELDLNKIKHVHFIGIGGIGISAIARMMLGEGKKVSGQDMQDSEIISALRKMGAEITLEQSFENIPKDADLIVYTIAIEYYDPELFKKLKEQNIPIRSYPEMLGLVSKDKYTIAVSGTHGKTTTTGMIAQILSDVGKDPTVVVGSLLKASQKNKNFSGLTLSPGASDADQNFYFSTSPSNFMAGKSNLFVAEVCEYRRSFLNINPDILVITNIDEDHLDYYKDIEDIKSAFRELALKVPASGFVVCDPNDKNIADVIQNISAKIINYQEFFDADLKLKIPGMHNKKDASCAVAVATLLDIKKDEAQSAVANFPGTARRFEYKGELSNGAKLYDDYAHHPAEIQATLQGFRELYPKSEGYRVMVIFQPHLFSRTKLLLKEFAESFGEADRVLLLPIYYAREVDDSTITSAILSDEINKHQNNAEAFYDFETVEKKIKEMELNSKDIIVTMGAGEAFKIGDSML